MKVKLLVLAAALLMLSSLSFAQPFVACITNDCFQLREDQTGAPLADGTVGVIYYAASGIPSPSDQPATLCNNPPNCPDGPPGTVNVNQVVLNAGDWGLDPGEFIMDPCFTSSGVTPVPATYYIVFTTPHGGKWTSSLMTLQSGPQAPDLCNWSWSTPPPPQCTASGNVTFPVVAPVNGPQNGSACIVLCSTTNGGCATVCVGPLLTTDPNIAAGRRPHVVLSYGNCTCSPEMGLGWTFNGDYAGWTLQLISGQYYYCQQICIGSGHEGCAMLSFDFILAAEMGNIAIVPSDNAVNINFNTLSETNLARFDIRRDGQVIARLNATNSATGSNYSYVDKSASNGTSYKYELVAVNMDGSQTVVKTENNVMPSMDKLVVTEYALHQNFPNPFNPTTSIRFDLVAANNVSLKIYNANGQVVATLVNGERKAGVNIVNFDATNLTSGLYFYTVKVGNVYSATKKMLLVK